MERMCESESVTVTYSSEYLLSVWSGEEGWSGKRTKEGAVELEWCMMRSDRNESAAWVGSVKDGIEHNSRRVFWNEGFIN